MKIFILVLVVTSISFFVVFLTIKKNKKQEFLNPDTIEKEILDNKSVLLDVRTSAELQATGWAQDAIHFDITKIENGELPNIDKDKKIYIYCRSGGRAGRAVNILKNNGYNMVYNIGGLNDWINLGGKVTKQ